jgi:hypothetical protein
MRKIIVDPLDVSSIDAAITELKDYKVKFENAGQEITKRLADIGYQTAFTVMSGHIFSGETIESLSVESAGDGSYILSANSEAILFFEFGAGARYSSTKHPWGDELDLKPGKYPGSQHWDDPDGWWFPTDDPRLIVSRNQKTGQGWGHSYGNRPYMPFYKADKAMRRALLKVAKEVLK